MSHFELFRCDAVVDPFATQGLMRVIDDQCLCPSFLEIADTFPTLVLSQIRDAEWTTVQDLGKPERHYCPIHKAVAA